MYTRQMVGILAVLVSLLAPTLNAQALRGVVGYNVKQIAPRLAKAEKLLDQGDRKSALSYFETAKVQWEALQKDYKGQYDAKHPEIVAMQATFDSLGKRLAAAGSEVVKPAAPASPKDVGTPAGKAPPAAMLYAMKQVGPRLAKAERLLDQGDRKNALSYCESSKTQWQALLEDYTGQYDRKHPEIVAMQATFDSLGKRLAAAGSEVEKPAAPASPKDVGASAGKAPPAAMVYVMKQIDATLDETQQLVEAQLLRKATAAFKSAEQNWTAQQQWNKGKYDVKDPSIIALATKYEKVKALVERLTRESAEAAKTLPVVVEAIESSQKNLDTAYQAAQSIFRDVSSLMSDFDSGRQQDVDKLRVKVDELRLRAERVNSLLPSALAAAKAFRIQYPDFSTLGNLVRDGRSAGQAVERLEKFPANWLEDSKRLVDEALGYAKDNIRQFGTEKLSALEGGDTLRQGLAADAAELWVLQYSSYLLEVIPSILPTLPAEAQATLPEFAAARKGFETRAEPMRGSIKTVATAVVKLRKDVADAQRQRLERARFPTTTHKVGAEEKPIKQAWAKAIKDKKLLRLSIYSPYEVRKEARWRNDTWVVNTYRYIGANCLAQLSSGKFMVYRMNFRNTRQADGSWSELAHWSVGHVFEISKENIDK